MCFYAGTVRCYLTIWLSDVPLCQNSPLSSYNMVKRCVSMPEQSIVILQYGLAMCLYDGTVRYHLTIWFSDVPLWWNSPLSSSLFLSNEPLWLSDVPLWWNSPSSCYLTICLSDVPLCRISPLSSYNMVKGCTSITEHSVVILQHGLVKGQSVVILHYGWRYVSMSGQLVVIFEYELILSRLKPAM